MDITPGLTGSAVLIVGEEHTAPRVGSGKIHVLATPVMINLIEAAALAALQKAADREDATEKHVVTPGPLIPAREVLAYVVLDEGDAVTALRHFESVLRREPNRQRAFVGALRAARQAGNTKKVDFYAGRLAQLTSRADR